MIRIALSLCVCVVATVWSGTAHASQDAPREAVSTQVDSAPKADGSPTIRPIDALVELGPQAVSDLSEKALTQRSTLAIRALGSIGGEVASDTLIACLNRAINDPLPYRTDLTETIRAVKRCQAAGAQGALVELMNEGESVEDEDSPVLAFALEAAGALIVLGEGDVKAEASEFISSKASRLVAGLEDLSRIPLLVALAHVGTAEALDRVAQYIREEYFLTEEVFVCLPRKTNHRGIVEALYERLQSMERFGDGPGVHFAVMEALSEMKLRDQVVSLGFWQEHWDTNKFHLVRRDSGRPYASQVTEGMLSARMRAFIERMSLTI